MSDYITDGVTDGRLTIVNARAWAQRHRAALHRATAYRSIDFHGLAVHADQEAALLLPADLAGPMIAHGRGIYRTRDAELGVDLIYLPPDEAFPLHVHPGHHLLMTILGRGSVTYDGRAYDTREGDVYMIPGDVEHAVGSSPTGHWLLAFGAHPHKHISGDDRMTLR